ncbi:uncharacterized protein LOC111320217, partial [Stylophora pistillata]|uniref:uncharacterized protein LOC111320217 n=1 Tax=Stylophora pistillata TaxID=50429 RepID=UPI000C04BD46
MSDKSIPTFLEKLKIQLAQVIDPPGFGTDAPTAEGTTTEETTDDTQTQDAASGSTFSYGSNPIGDTGGVEGSASDYAFLGNTPGLGGLPAFPPAFLPDITIINDELIADPLGVADLFVEEVEDTPIPLFTEGDDVVDFNDVVPGSFLGSPLDALGGNDIVTFTSSAALSTALGLTGVEFTGGPGIDLLFGGSLSEIFNGGPGDDIISGGAGDDIINGGDGDDLILGGFGSNSLFGGAGEDTIDYSGSPTPVFADLLSLNANNTSLAIPPVDQEINDTLGEDIENVNGSPFDDIIFGNASSNSLVGNAGNDFIDGGGGNDNLFGNAGTDDLFGGEGDDTINGGADDDFLDGGAGSDTLNGDEGDDQLSGGEDNDLLNGGTDDDDLDGGAGDNTLDGGAGSDTANYSISIGPVEASLAAGTSSGINHDDVLVDIENLEGSDFNDTLTGDSGSNIINANDGDDLVNGGLGDDDLDGGDGFDTADYSDAPGPVTVSLADETATGAAGDDIVENFEEVIGSDSNDVLEGNSEDDILNGGLGDDRLLGTAGEDTLRGEGGQDTVDYSSASSGYVIDLEFGEAFQGGVEDESFENLDALEGIENAIGTEFDDFMYGDDNVNTFSGLGGADDLHMNGGNDVGFGGAGNDRLFGGEDDDQLSGGDGNDIIDGGTGSDTANFLFSSSA